MNVSFNGFNTKALTFICEGDIFKGYGVKITDNSTVSMCEEGEAFTGICLDSDNENAVVQMTGYVKMPYSEGTPALGRTSLVCGPDGSVKEGEDGTVCTVLAVNPAESTVEFLF